MENAVWQLICVVYAKFVLFMQGVFYSLSHCDINEALRLIGGEIDEQRQKEKSTLCGFEEERC